MFLVVSYETERKFLCDTCGEKIEGKNNCTLKEHILHLINPSYLWSCEACFQDDLRNNRIIATSLLLVKTSKVIVLS